MCVCCVASYAIHVCSRICTALYSYFVSKSKKNNIFNEKTLLKSYILFVLIQHN